MVKVICFFSALATALSLRVNRYPSIIPDVTATPVNFRSNNYDVEEEDLGGVLVNTTNATNASVADHVESTGDPHVINMAGQKFDIKKLGIHSLLNIFGQDTFKPLLEISGLINRAKLPYLAEEVCAPTYIRSLSFKGVWIDEKGHMDLRGGNAPLPRTFEIGVRALPYVSPEKALEVGFDGHWQKTEKFFNYSHIEVKNGQWAKVNLRLHGLDILVELLTVSRSDPEVGKYGGFNFLNLNIDGLANLNALPDAKTFQYGGLLAFDDFEEVSEGDDSKCKHSLSLWKHGVKTEQSGMLSSARIAL